MTILESGMLWPGPARSYRVKRRASERRLKIQWRNSGAVFVEVFAPGKDAEPLIGALEAVPSLVVASTDELRDRMSKDLASNVVRRFIDLQEPSNVGRSLMQPGRYEIFLVERNAAKTVLYFVRGEKDQARLVNATSVQVLPSSGKAEVEPVRFVVSEKGKTVSEIQLPEKILRLH